MRGPHNLWRLARTLGTFDRTGALRVVQEKANLPKTIAFALRVKARILRIFGYKGDPALPALPRALIALGPAYIKFGQLLSTRPDIVGQDLADELSILQDQLPPFSQELALKQIEKELDKPISELFSSISEPVAAASLAQVHKAVLPDGSAVAVKVLRPNIERAFMRDVDAFHLGAWLLENFSPASRRLRPIEVVNHFQHLVEDELDLRMEASVGSEYGENIQNDAGFHAPKIIWSHSAKEVLTTAWVEGISLGRMKEIDAAHINREKLAASILQNFLTQALRDGLFHGDMHQGNIKVSPSGEVTVFDFGIMGRIDSFTRRVYAEILYGFLTRDYQRVARVHFEAGYVPKNQNEQEFAQALRSVGEPIFGQDSASISMARLFGHLFEITERFGMQTQTELILLQRTMVVVEGVARSLNPDINIWETARPVVQDYIQSNMGPLAALKDAVENVKQMNQLAQSLPKLIEEIKAEQKAWIKERRANQRASWFFGLLIILVLISKK